jgi:hypothetical protein
VIREFRAAAASIVRGGEPELEPGVSEFVRNVFDLDAALEMGFTITLAEVTPIEFRALLVLREERARYQESQRLMAEAKARSQQMSRNGF